MRQIQSFHYLYRTAGEREGERVMKGKVDLPMRKVDDFIHAVYSYEIMRIASMLPLSLVDMMSSVCSNYHALCNWSISLPYTVDSNSESNNKVVMGKDSDSSVRDKENVINNTIKATINSTISSANTSIRSTRTSLGGSTIAIKPTTTSTNVIGNNSDNSDSCIPPHCFYFFSNPIEYFIQLSRYAIVWLYDSERELVRVKRNSVGKGSNTNVERLTAQVQDIKLAIQVSVLLLIPTSIDSLSLSVSIE